MKYYTKEETQSAKSQATTSRLTWENEKRVAWKETKEIEKFRPDVIDFMSIVGCKISQLFLIGGRKKLYGNSTTFND
jgi:hypothetical protein